LKGEGKDKRMTLFFARPHPAAIERGVLAVVSIRWTAGLLEGLELKGITVWRSIKTEGTVWVSMPSRIYTKQGEQKYWWLIQPIDPDDEVSLNRFRQTIITAYRDWATNTDIVR
jgi:hypothetical protein